MNPVKLGLLAVLIGAAPLAHAQPSRQPPPQRAEPIVTRHGEVAELSGRGGEMAFVAGSQVRVTAQVSDDVFAAGRDLRVEGASANHLFVAGGEIDLAPAAVEDLVAAGGRIQLRAGVVRDDVVAAGGDIRLDANARIGGSAVLTGGRLRIDAPVGGQLSASGGRIELNGPVGGDVRLRGDEIVIGPQARIAGDLYVRGAEVDVSPGAVVQGRTVREVVQREERSAAAGFMLLAALFTLGVLLMAAAIAAAAPRLVDGVDRRLRSRLWVATAIGLGIVLLAPILIVALLATLLGAPLGLLLALAYLAALPLAFAGVAYSAGQWIRGRVTPARAAEPPRWPARLGWTLLAALLIALACMIPLIGGLIWLFVVATGMGALAANAVDANWRARGSSPEPTTA